MSAPPPFRSHCNRYCSIFLLLRQGSHTERWHIYCCGASIGLLRRMLLCVVQRLVLRRCECSEATIVVSCAIVVVANDIPATGILNRNSEPHPLPALKTSTFPPCSSASDLTIASPRPSPPSVRASVRLPCV